MTIKISAEADIIREANEVLLQHLAPSKVVRFWASWHRGGDNYLAWREAEFGEESVNSLYEKLVAFQQTDA